MAQVFNEASYEGTLVCCNGPRVDSSRPLVDSKHSIDLMQLDRNLILDLIALESKREDGYRHPHLCIVALAFRSRRAGRELYEEHPCTSI